jgi:hypothetical protein
MPLEVVRRRVARAAELGLDYGTYAGIRAASGRDVVAFLFSTNALRMEAAPRPPADRMAHVERMRRCDRVVLALPPHDPAAVTQRLGLRAAPAPASLAPWAAARSAILDALGTTPADGVVLVGAAGFERDWADAARLAAFLRDDRVFGVRRPSGA